MERENHYDKSVRLLPYMGPKLKSATDYLTVYGQIELDNCIIGNNQTLNKVVILVTNQISKYDCLLGMDIINRITPLRNTMDELRHQIETMSKQVENKHMNNHIGINIIQSNNNFGIINNENTKRNNNIGIINNDEIFESHAIYNKYYQPKFIAQLENINEEDKYQEERALIMEKLNKSIAYSMNDIKPKDTEIKFKIELKDSMAISHKTSMKIRNHRMDINKIFYDRNIKKFEYKVGDLVLVDHPYLKQKGLAKGIAPKYYGPFEILKRIGSNYVIQRIDVVRKKIQMVHQNRLKYYNQRMNIHADLESIVSSKNETKSTKQQIKKVQPAKKKRGRPRKNITNSDLPDINLEIDSANENDITTNSYSSSDTENSCITNSNDKVTEWFNMKTGNFEPIRKSKRQIKKPIRYNYN